jgi:hypothetical protein
VTFRLRVPGRIVSSLPSRAYWRSVRGRRPRTTAAREREEGFWIPSGCHNGAAGQSRGFDLDRSRWNELLGVNKVRQGESRGALCVWGCGDGNIASETTYGGTQ